MTNNIEKISQAAAHIALKIKCNEQANCMLCLKYYKFLSDRQVQFLEDESMTDEEIGSLSEDDLPAVEYIQKNMGYFIDSKNLFSSWIEKGSDFDISDVRDALSAFSRLVQPENKKEHELIFEPLQTGLLSRLGDTAVEQTAKISNMIYLIEDRELNNGSEREFS